MITNELFFDDFEELDILEENSCPNEKHSKLGRNKYTRKMKKNSKETKLFNNINNFYTYRSKWFTSKDGKHSTVDYLPNILGSGIYIRGTRTGLRGFYKRQAAKKVRKQLKDDFFNTGNTYKKIYGTINYMLI